MIACCIYGKLELGLILGNIIDRCNKITVKFKHEEIPETQNTDQTQSSPSLPGKAATISSIVSISKKKCFLCYLFHYIKL